MNLKNRITDQRQQNAWEENEKSLDKAFRRLGIIICCILM
jgi:hypothetical protein